MPYPTAEQVQNAFTTPLPIAQIQGIGEAAAQNRILGERRRQQQQAQQLHGLGLISSEIDPISKGTGFSPYDDMNTTHIGAVKQQATQMVMSGADPAAVYQFLQNATNGIKARQQDVIKGVTAAQNMAKTIAEKDPAYDQNAMYQQYIDNLFYTKDSKGSKSFNPNFNTGVDFTVGTQPVYDPMKLKELAAKEVGTLFPERETPAVPSFNNPLIGLYAKAPAYHTVDPRARQTVWNVKPKMIDFGERGKMELPLIDDGVAQSLFASKNTSRYLNMQAQELRAKLPKSVSDEDIQRIVATDYIREAGHQPGAGVNEDDKAFMRQRQAENDQFNKAMRIRSDQRDAERLNISKNKDANAQNAKIQKDLNSPYGIATLGLMRVHDPRTGAMVPANPDQFAQLHAHDERVKWKGVQEFTASNLNSFAGKQKDPIYVNGRPAQVHLIDKGGLYGLSIQYLQKQTTKRSGEGGKDEEVELTEAHWVPTGEAKIIRNEQFQTTWNSLAPQLGLTPGKYDAAYNEQPADKYPDTDF